MDFSGLFARNTHPEIARLARYFCDLAGDAPLPPRRGFAPLRIGPIVNYVFVIDVLADESDYYFSLFGNRMAALYGANLSGMRLSEVGDAALRQTLRKTYDRVVSTHLPLFLRGRYVWPEKSIAIERLLIPMADDEGQLNSICGIAMPDAADRDVALRAGHGAAQLVGDDELILSAA